jgi:hypothetical protein
MKKNVFLILIAGFLIWKPAFSQSIPIEIFGGNKKSTLDVMFFKYFKNKDESNSNFLFFNRNRASIEYEMTETSNLPQFGFTEAISYNDPKLKGFAPVGVVQVLNKGVYPKLGVQYVKIKEDITFFGWTVFETLKHPNIDLFILTRFTPKLTNKINLYSQLELLSNIPTTENNNYNFVQRIRLGLKLKEFQFGAGMDLVENGRKIYKNTTNTGGFLRYEF